MRIGAVGHRHLENEDLLAARIVEALKGIRDRIPASPATPVRMTVLSAVAEGADRLITEIALRDEGVTLEALLPLPRGNYEKDFREKGSRDDFRSLLSRATAVVEGPPTKDRDAAYEWAGRRVVDGCDVLLAVWDGSPPRGRAGTAEVIAYARARGVPVVWVRTDGRNEIVEEWRDLEGWLAAVFEPLDDFNRSEIRKATFDGRRDREERFFLRHGMDVGGISLPPLVEWSLPYFIRADILATRYQRFYEILGSTVFMAAALAVITAAAQSVFAPDVPSLVMIEVVLLVGLLVLVMIGRRRRVHERWISYRFLAERFRSAFFLAMTGVSLGEDDGSQHDLLSHPSEEWVRRAFREVWRERPPIPEPAAVELVRDYVIGTWIDNQIDYHERQARMHSQRDTVLGRATDALFGLTVVTALLFALRVGESDPQASFSPSELFAFLSGGLPALAAAMSGIRAQGEHLRHGERYSRMTRYLRAVRKRVEEAVDLQSLRALMVETEGIMLEENRDWFMVMRFHDFELHI